MILVYNSDEIREIEIKNSVLERVRSGYKVTYKQDEYDVLGNIVLHKI